MTRLEAPLLISKLSWRIKRLNYLYRRLTTSIALRGWRGTFARVKDEFSNRPHIDDSLPMAALDEPFQPFALPTFNGRPQVSVIIPVHGKVEYTIACLHSIARQAPRASLEIIVVDDASPDDTAPILRQIDGLQLLQNTANLGYVHSCNAAAAAANGEFLYFLNNDTQVTTGWLDALLACFAQEARCGIVGSRLVYPDGRLQEAGGVVYADGSCWNIGRFESRFHSAYRFRCPVDYVSGASLLIRRQIFEELGGFDTRYAPAYYEDTDLAFMVRRLGFHVFYEPSSVVIHFEGISAGTDLGTGMKRHQALNQAIFVEKWREDLKKQPPPGTPPNDVSRQRYRGHILIADVSTPNPHRDSGSLRLCEILRLLHEDGYQLSFFPDDGHNTNGDVDVLSSLGVEILCRPWISDLPEWLRQNGKYLDAVILCRHVVAGQYAEQVRKYAPQAMLIFDTVDLHFLREQRAAELTGHATMQRQAHASRQSELDLVRQSDVSFVVSTHEQTLLKQLIPEATVTLLSNIHRVYGRSKPYLQRKDLAFIGGYAHPPNADAIHWLADKIVPVLRDAFPEIVVHAFGDVPDDVRAALTRPGLLLHGRVPDLAPWLNGCIASIAPLRFGAGVKGKVNMAMSYGLPVIATPLAVEGMHLEDGKTALIADTPEEFVSAVGRLLDNEQLWLEISNSSLENIERHFSRTIARDTLRRTLARKQH